MTKENAVAVAKEDQLPAEIAAEMEADAGDGLQTITTDDMAVPFLRVLQKMSPQLAKRDGAYIEGAEEGQIFNTVTGELWDADEGLRVIPCAYNFKYIEWRPRAAGGGIANVYTRDEVLPETHKNEKKQDETNDGNLLMATAEHYIMLLGSDGSTSQAVVSMSSTQLKYSRKWNSVVNQQTISTKEGIQRAPMYSRVYVLKTFGETNDAGDWSSWGITLEGPVTDIVAYRAAKTFSKAVNTGDVQAKHVAEDAASTTASDSM